MKLHFEKLILTVEKKRQAEWAVEWSGVKVECGSQEAVLAVRAEGS